VTGVSPAATYPLEADCILKRWGSRVVLTSASVRASSGRVTGLLGRNGAGKTTLLRVLVGLESFDGGTVRVNGVGHDRVRLPALARQGVFFLPDRDLLHPQRPIDEQLAWVWMASRHLETLAASPHPATCAGTESATACEERVCDLLLQLGIGPVRRSRPGMLSGGERRRAEVACALIRAPRVLVLDEPLRGIAPLDAEAILGALRRYAADGGAVLVTGHELPLLIGALDTITWCHATRTREFGTVDHALRDAAFRSDFLGTSREGAISSSSR
jgi:ABC-type multidrug transport system ATPase subunit